MEYILTFRLFLDEIEGDNGMVTQFQITEYQP